MTKKIRLQYKRKREGKTNYKKRLTLLKSRTNRLVIRKTNKYLSAQVISYEPSGDKVIVGVTSKALQKLGWNHSCKNLSACYLTGVLLGKKASEKKIKEAILDLGLHTPIKGSRLYVVLKGVVDSGINVPCSDDIFPSDDRIKGLHISEKIAKDFESLKKKIEN